MDSNRPCVYYFSDPPPDGPGEAKRLLGGKGASLNAMSRAGLQVPPGFTISTECCRCYFERERKWPEGLEEEVRRNLRRLEEETGRPFGRGAVPLLVSVRSGAAVSMPGMMDTLLNCPLHAGLADQVGDTPGLWNLYLQFIRSFAHTVDHLDEGFFDELDRRHGPQPSRAHADAYLYAYRERTGRRLPDAPWDILVACINAVFDSWHNQRAVVYRQRHGIRALEGTAVNIQAMFPSEVSGVLFTQDPNDLDAGRMIVEASYGLGEAIVSGDVETGRREEIQRLEALAGDKRKVWIAHNLAETLRHPTPLTWDIVGRFISGSGGFGRMYRQLGYRPSRKVSREGFLELIGGRIYADPDRLAEMFWDGIPVRYELAALLEDKTLLDRGPTKFDPNKADGRFLRKLPGTLLAMWRASRKLRRLRSRARRTFEQEILPAYLEYVEEKRREELASLSDVQVLAELDDRCQRVLRQFGAESLKPGFLAGLAFDALQGLLVQLLGKQAAAELAATLTRALEGDTTFEQDALLYRVAAGQATLEEFLERFGHRSSDEMELAEPRWRENPAYLRQMIDRFRADSGRSPEEIHRQNLTRRRAAEEQLPAILARCGGSSLRERIQRDLAEVRDLLPLRESGKHYLMMGYELIRAAIEQLAARWDLGAGIYFLRRDELEHYPARRQELDEQIARRRTRWQALKRLHMAEVIDSDHLDGLGLPEEIESLDELQGTAVASGVATGMVRVVFDPQAAGDLGEGYVLVCPSTDPGWTPLFMAAAGLIVERGGMLSHGAIVARDFGIPAVVCPHATRLLETGDHIRIDGASGKITVIERAVGTAV